ncbi:MAG TPA: tripartite tricarboxylate transporter substrate binding protein [Burkholderiales bacterium]|nr:tripartite tricarboxylate transporter substrate binding protein [Burkholderiales bacterium]
MARRPGEKGPGLRGLLRLRLDFHNMRFIAAAVLLLVSFSASAQSYPSKPIRFLAGYPPGGGVDNVARALGEKLSPRLGQQIVVENRPGAGGAIANDAVTKSAPDGYTLLIGPIGTQAILQYSLPKRTYDFGRDLTPVSRIGYGTIIFVVPAASKAQSVKDFVAMAKASPGKLTFASSGTGALIHLTGELFKQAAGLDLLHVPYKGTTQILPDLLDGRIDMALDSAPAYLPHLKAGRVRAMAVASPKRSALMPDLPTMAEAGVPGVVSQTDYAVYAPAGTPRDVIALLNREVNAVLQMEDFRARMASLGVEVAGGTPESLHAEYTDELAKWGKVIRDAKLKFE